uniref:Putative secreted protein n=1 Tax=Anopheles darlingi TaxID=43151 RepID=A0A2M4DQ47_ANODA
MQLFRWPFSFPFSSSVAGSACVTIKQSPGNPSLRSDGQCVDGATTLKTTSATLLLIFDVPTTDLPQKK